jgi:hypothetical protein
MMVKEYKSFKEIDARLRVLKLQREIDQESLRLHYHRARVDLIPRKLIQGLGATLAQSSTWKNMLLAFATKKVLGILRKRRQKEIKK